MAKRPPLPKSELEIARIVWDLGEATVREVLEALPEDRELDFWTVQTYLRRLKDKGYLKTRREGRNNVYSPKVAPDRVVGQVVGDFLDQVFDGEALPLFQHLIHDRGLSDEEVDQLQKTLDKLRRHKR
ncbi:MAG: BlaI/MecI/CopY family transcriptional regulator [Pirellulales bacterium]|nr:BlaI/MecI/CopY family transcriptional regulator [Pirellulales bacterium]